MLLQEPVEENRNSGFFAFARRLSLNSLQASGVCGDYEAPVYLQEELMQFVFTKSLFFGYLLSVHFWPFF